jgi:GGDEF domain-containing protein
MTQKTSSDTALLYRSLEKQASRHPVRTIRLNGKRPEPLGLLLIDADIPVPEVASALAGLRLADQLRPATAVASGDASLPDQAWLHQQLTAELARVQQTRLPCALLLITLSGKPPTKNGATTLIGQAATALASSLHPVDVLASFQNTGLALIMPGATMGKARKRAEEIRTTLRTTTFTTGATTITPKLALGIAVCHAYETIAPEQLLLLAEAELSRAAKLGGDAICQRAASQTEDSCQVTVEERAQLWLQPRKPSRATAGMAA